MRKEFTNLVISDSPCWYELSWQEKESGIILRIHKDFIKSIDFRFEDSVIIKDLKNELNLPEFSGDFSGDIGFDKVFKRIGEKGDFVEFLIEIPRVGDNFLACKISASFSGFRYLTNDYRKGSSSSLPQLFTVSTMTKIGMNGGSLWGMISNPLKEWLLSFNDDEAIPEIEEAMKIANMKMCGSSINYPLRFFIRENGKFIADFASYACSISPVDWDLREGRGYKFTSSNVDNFIQQLTLLVSLAVLHDKARREMKNNLVKKGKK